MKRLAIVGTGPSTRGDAPWDDPSFDIWVLNEAPNQSWCERWSACFQIHPPEIYRGYNAKDAHHWEWLQRDHRPFPIYMQAVDPLVPSSVEFPLQAAIDLIGFPYLSSSIADAAALAALQGYEHIEFYGVEMSTSEYQAQAKGYIFWIGFLIGRLGKDHVIHHMTYRDRNIFEAVLYGYDANFAFGSEYFNERAKVHDANWQAAAKHAKNLMKSVERATENSEAKKAQALTVELDMAMMVCGEHAGAFAEAQRYATFGERFADRGGFEKQAALLQQSSEVAKAEKYTLLGKIEYVWNIWQQTGNQQAAAQMILLTSQMGAKAEEVGALKGGMAENYVYMEKYDGTVLAGGKALIES